MSFAHRRPNGARFMLVAPLVALGCGEVSPAHAQYFERHVLDGDAIAVHNLVGQIRVVPATGGRAEVSVVREGADAAELRVETDRSGEWHALRVVYPGDRIVYPRLGRGSRSQLYVGDDGAFDGLVEGARSRRVTIAGTGRGTRAHADLTVHLPPGKRAAIHLALGEVEVTNVQGDLRIHTRAARVTTDRTHGPLRISGRSGPVRVLGAMGDLEISNRAGRVQVDGGRGDRLHISARSGGVRASDLAFDDADISVGSGSIRLEDVRGGRLVARTRSGSVNAAALEIASIELGARSGSVRLDGLQGDALRIDTRSGSVRGVRLGFANLEIGTGSGSIDLDDLATDSLRVDARSGSVRLRLASRSAGGHIGTGSGSVTLRVPPVFDADLELRSRGSIRVDAAAQAVESSRDRFSGRLGSGGPRLEIHTRSGGIRILEG